MQLLRLAIVPRNYAGCNHFRLQPVEDLRDFFVRSVGRVTDKQVPVRVFGEEGVVGLVFPHKSGQFDEPADARMFVFVPTNDDPAPTEILRKNPVHFRHVPVNARNVRRSIKLHF